MDRHNTSNDERNNSDSDDGMDDEQQSPQNNAPEPVEVFYGYGNEILIF